MMEATRHKLMDGRVQLYRRPNSPCWWCSCTLDGAQRRASTNEESLAKAKDAARDWYLSLLGKLVAGDLAAPTKAAANDLRDVDRYLSGDLKDIGKIQRGGRKRGVTFREAAEKFLAEYEIITEGERNPDYVRQQEANLRVHILPFMGDKLITEITPGTVQEYRAHRMTSRVDAKTGLPKRPARSTLHHEIITLRHVLKTANRHGWLPYLPDISAPYKTNGKIAHRAWFSPAEWKTFYTATRDRAKNPLHNRGRWKEECEDFHDFCLVMVGTGLRPDEAKRVEFRDVTVVTDDATGERILEIAVRGKRGTGWCKSMPSAVFPFQRLLERRIRRREEEAKKAGKTWTGKFKLDMTERAFPQRPRDLLNAVLSDLNMRLDREGNRRTTYSFRHTYISMRLSEGADIYAVAKNCRTSVEMIEKFYASHIKDMIDASAVNVRKAKPSNRRNSKEAEE